MSYLLVALVLALILSSLIWIKPSARQKKSAQMRSLASSKGLNVQLSKAPDAREGEGRLEYVQYQLHWPLDSKPNPTPFAEDWLLVKNTRRGDPSPWADWRWLGRKAAGALHPFIERTLNELPEDVVGLAASGRNLSIFWREQGELEEVACIAEALENLRVAIRQ